MSTSPHEYLTVAEAAELLRVSVSTIRRWIREGTMRAHRVGRRRLLLERGELLSTVRAVESYPTATEVGRVENRPSQPATLASFIAEPNEEEIGRLRAQLGLPPRGEAVDLGPVADRVVRSPDQLRDRRLTAEEQARAFAAIARSEALRAELLARNGGKLFSDSVQIIHEMRDERTRQLMGEEDIESVPVS